MIGLHRAPSARAGRLRGWRAPVVSLGCTALVATAALSTAPSAEVVRIRPAASSVQSPNLLQGDQAGFDGTSGGWVGQDAELSWAARPSNSPGGSLAVTSTSTHEAWACSALPPSGTPTPATPGALYTGSAQLDSQAIELGGYDVLGFYSDTGTALSAVWSQVGSVSPGSWTTLPPVAALAPPSTASVVLCVVVGSSLPEETVYLDAPSLSAPSTAPSPAIVGPLHTAGSQIVQANGDPVHLRGVVLTGLQSNASAPGVMEQAVTEAEAWGANFVRVPLGEQFWLRGNCDYVAGYADTVDQVVEWITSLGMLALLDLHFNTVGGCEPGAAHNMADAAQAPEFWSQVAARYGRNPLVAFDLYNEPHDISDAVWLNGGRTKDVYYPYQSYEAAGMQQLYDAVRSTGAENLIFVSGNNWANTVPTHLVQGTNIVYSVHAYTCPDSAPPNCSRSNPYNRVSRFQWGEHDPIFAGWMVFGQVTPPVCNKMRSL